MGNLVLGWPNRIDDATLSGGAWEAAAPLAFLQDKRIRRAARTSSAAAASTQFDIDFGSTKSLRAFALINHNLSASATVRITAGGSIGSAAVADTGWVSVVRMALEADELEWEDANFWDGSGDEWLRNVHPFIVVLADTVTARWVRIEILDEANADEFVQIGRVFVGPMLEPQYNDDLGRAQGFEDLTTFKAPGAQFADPGLRLKTAQLQLSWLSAGEVRYLRGIARQDGADADVLFCPSSTDSAAQQEFGFLGTVVSGLEALSQEQQMYSTARLVLRERA